MKQGGDSTKLEVIKMANKSMRKGIMKEFKTQKINKDEKRFEEMKAQLRPDLRRGLKKFILIETDNAGNAIPQEKLHKDGIPIVECEETKDGSQVFFYCLYCKRKHYHGNVKDEDGNLGHRVAHCINKKSPFLHTGYYLILKSEV